MRGRRLVRGEGTECWAEELEEAGWRRRRNMLQYRSVFGVVAPGTNIIKILKKIVILLEYCSVAAPGARALARRGTWDQPLAKRGGPGKIWPLYYGVMLIVS
jgi:hypothetical protein